MLDLYLPYQYLHHMKITIDKTRCAGCSICQHMAPTLFYMNGYHAAISQQVIDQLQTDEILQYKLQEVLNTCPAGAITITYDEGEQPLNTD